MRGRQVLFMFDQYFKTSEEAGNLYSLEDLLRVSRHAKGSLTSIDSSMIGILSLLA